ncbi:hypothetical protein B0H14DRAFT_1371983 [Mycena olivaceomarginata]|nr:hypothetical protein B0H14DRAFT_1371983 [Mycena olivaceomarginata]
MSRGLDSVSGCLCRRHRRRTHQQRPPAPLSRAPFLLATAATGPQSPTPPTTSAAAGTLKAADKSSSSHSHSHHGDHHGNPLSPRRCSTSKSCSSASPHPPPTLSHPLPHRTQMGHTTKRTVPPCPTPALGPLSSTPPFMWRCGARTAWTSSPSVIYTLLILAPASARISRSPSSSPSHKSSGRWQRAQRVR